MASIQGRGATVRKKYEPNSWCSGCCRRAFFVAAARGLVNVGKILPRDCGFQSTVLVVLQGVFIGRESILPFTFLIFILADAVLYGSG